LLAAAVFRLDFLLRCFTCCCSIVYNIISYMSVFVSVRSDVETKMTSSSADGGRRVALTFLLVILVQNGLLTHNQIIVCDNVIYVRLNETCYQAVCVCVCVYVCEHY